MTHNTSLFAKPVVSGFAECVIAELFRTFPGLLKARIFMCLVESSHLSDELGAVLLCHVLSLSCFPRCRFACLTVRATAAGLRYKLCPEKTDNF